MRIVAADSGSAILNEEFAPQKIVAVSAICTEVPYRNAFTQLSELLMTAVNQHDLIVKELRMCKKLLRLASADAVHLDMSLGGIPVSQLTMSDLQDMSISSKAKQRIREVLPELRKQATEIEQEFNVELLAIGKESLPVRIAELTAGAYSVIYASAEALKHQRTILLGLPALCTIALGEREVTARSLQQGEHDVVGFAEDSDNVIQKIKIEEFSNPAVRGFRVLRIAAKEA